MSGPPAEPPLVDRTLVAPIVLDDAHGRWRFAPRPDITPLEAALIGQLFVAMTLRRTRLDWREYLTRSRPFDLSRHFEVLE